MKNHLTTSRYKSLAKGNRFVAQKKQIYKAFLNTPKTMLMVSIETGVLRANICRYVAEWKNQGRIVEVRKGICPLSKHKATFYIAIPEQFNNE